MEIQNQNHRKCNNIILLEEEARVITVNILLRHLIFFFLNRTVLSRIAEAYMLEKKI